MDLKGRWESPKDLRKSCCRRIKCTVTTFLAAFMWRRHLNSETLVTTTHKEPGNVADRTDTQVKFQMNDKCRVKMIRKELYNVKNPLCRGGGGKSNKKEKKLIKNYMKKRSLDIKGKPLGLRRFLCLVRCFHSNYLWTCDDGSLNSLKPSFPTHSLQICCLGLVRPVHNQFGPQTESPQDLLVWLR